MTETQYNEIIALLTRMEQQMVKIKLRLKALEEQNNA